MIASPYYVFTSLLSLSEFIPTTTPPEIIHRVHMYVKAIDQESAIAVPAGYTRSFRGDIFVLFKKKGFDEEVENKDFRVGQSCA